MTGDASVFVRNGDVRLHVLDSRVLDSRALDSRALDNRGLDDGARESGRRGAPLPPVLVIPGMGEYAAEYGWLLDRLGDRRVVIVDVRGRGGSDAPPAGYSWEDHIGDLRAVVDSLDLDRPVLIAFSRGSSYALGYALQFPDQVRGLVVGDYLARHAGLPAEFAERLLRMEVRGVPVWRRMPEHAVRAVVAESREVPLWDRLAELKCPVLVIRGGRRSAVVTDEFAGRWRASLPSAEVVTIPNAGHDLWTRDVDGYLAVLLPFLARVDAG